MQKNEFDALLEALRLRGSELDDVEVKEARGGTPTRLWESISALANRRGGGTLIFGLQSETFKAVGVADIDGLQRDLASVCGEMNPPVRARMTVFLERGARVLVAMIPECPREQKPCHHKGSGMTAGAFIRVGDGDRRMTDYEIQSLIAERGQPKDDLRPVSEASVEALDASAVERFFAEQRRRNPDAKHLQASTAELMKTYGIVTEESGVTRPTLCGLLMFSDFPQRSHPNLCMTLVRYAGPRDSSAAGADEMIENQKIEGSLPAMLDGVLSAVRRNMRRGTLKSGLLAEDVWEYPEPALREALVNAVGHRDYGPWALGTQVQVKMFADAIIIQNPGGLFGPVSEETLDEINIQSTRNPFLMRLLEASGFVETRGSGIRTMIAQLTRAGLPPPRFEDRRSHFRAVFLNETLLDGATIEWLNTFAPYPINERQRRGLAYLKRYRSIKNKDYCRLNGCDSRAATAELGHLRELGVLRQSGTRGGAVYSLSSPASVSVLPGGLKRRHMKVLDFFQNNPGRVFGARDISLKAGLNHETVRAALRDLVRAGFVVPTEEKARSSRQAYRINVR